jgi:hypothetical protein
MKRRAPNLIPLRRLPEESGDVELRVGSDRRMPAVGATEMMIACNRETAQAPVSINTKRLLFYSRAGTRSGQRFQVIRRKVFQQQVRACQSRSATQPLACSSGNRRDELEYGCWLPSSSPAGGEEGRGGDVGGQKGVASPTEQEEEEEEP